MKIYLSSINPDYISKFKNVKYLNERTFNLLYSYYYVKKLNKELIKYISQKQVSLFLDSGAFSAWSQGAEINLEQYVKFIKEHEQYLDVYANLDVINNAEMTLRNQQYMEDQGLHPLPCYHLGEDIKYLEFYVANYDYIALGGMVSDISRQTITIQLDQIYSKYLCNSDGSAKIKVHGFGCTGINVMQKYPWYSVDSTSWVSTGAFGHVFCSLGNINKIRVSDKSDKTDTIHFLQLKKHDQENIRAYFRQLGNSYEIEELAIDHKKRNEVNILYFLNLERQLTENPPRFNDWQQELF